MLADDQIDSREGRPVNFAFIRKLAQRDLKSGEVALLLISLVVAVGTVTSISLFVDRLHQALLAEAQNSYMEVSDIFLSYSLV